MRNLNWSRVFFSKNWKMPRHFSEFNFK